MEACRATLNSCLAHFQHAQSRRCLGRLWQKFAWLERFFVVSSRKVVRRDEPLRRKARLRTQVLWLKRAFKGRLILVQIGGYYEAFDASAEVLSQAAGLRLNQNWRGFASGSGFPQTLLAAVLAKLKKQKLPVVIAHETGREAQHAKQRALSMIIEYPTN